MKEIPHDLKNDNRIYRTFHVHFVQVPKYIIHANLKTGTDRGMISENSRCLCYNYPHN